MRYVRPLDGLRAGAVLAVFAFHLPTAAVRGGFVGVDVFFVLSGFLITGLLVDEHARRGRVDLPAFWRRRAARLYPALILCLVLAAAITPVLDLPWTGFGLDALSALLYVFNFRAATGAPSVVGHLWSLSVEEQFYLLWPPLAWWALRRGRSVARLAAGLAAVAVVCKAAALLVVPSGTLYFLPFGHADELLIGAALGALFVVDPAHRVFAATTRQVLPASALAVLGAAAFLIPGFTTTGLYAGGLTVLALCAAAVVAHVAVRPDSRIGRLLSLGPLVALGRRSYGFYLFHQPVLILLKERTDLQVRYLALLGLAVSLLLTWLSFRFVERPAAARLRRGQPAVRSAGVTATQTGPRGRGETP